MVQIEERAGWYYARVPRPRGAGRALKHSLGTRSLEEAKQMVRDSNLEQIALASRADALTCEVWTRLLAGRRVTVAVSIAAYREHKHATGHSAISSDQQTRLLDQFVRKWGFGTESIAAVTAKHVSEFVNQPGPQALKTRSWWLDILSGWLNFCANQRWIIRNPAVDVVVRLADLTQAQLVSRPHKAFTEGEVTTLISEVSRPTFWHGAILLGYHFGLRIGAVAILEESNIVAHELRVYTLKGRRIVHERLPDELIAWFELWKPLRPVSETPYLFPEQAAIYLAGSPLLSVQFKRLLMKHGMKDRVFHGLRKTATARVWNGALADLGDRNSQLLAKLVAENGYRKVQQMLAHAPGSDVTSDHYLPPPSPR